MTGGGLQSAAGADFAAALVEQAHAKGAAGAQVDHTAHETFEIDAETHKIGLIRTTFGEDTALTVFRDGRRGEARFSGRKAETIDGALAQAMSAAAASQPDPAHRIARAASHQGGGHGAKSADRAAMVETVRGHIDLMAARYPALLTRHSIYTFSDEQRSFCNSAGLVQAERRGAYGVGLLFAGKSSRGTTSFNYTQASAFAPFARLIDAGSVKRSIEDTLRGFDPQPVPRKFIGDVIVAPDCLAGLIGSVATALGGYALLAGTTPFQDRQGEVIANPAFSLLNRPRSHSFPGGSDFDRSGVPTENRDLIRDGRLVDFLVDHYIAGKLDRPQTAGHTNLVVPAGTRPLEDLIAETEQGVLLSRFSGGRPNDKLDFSGIAKNSFYIEGGKIQHALTETMVTGNLQDLLLSVRDLSRESVNFGDCAFPYLAAGGVTISSH